jgi:hypothetical protein
VPFAPSLPSCIAEMPTEKPAQQFTNCCSIQMSSSLSNALFRDQQLPVDTAMCDYFVGWGNIVVNCWAFHSLVHLCTEYTGAAASPAAAGYTGAAASPIASHAFRLRGNSGISKLVIMNDRPS